MEYLEFPCPSVIHIGRYNSGVSENIYPRIPSALRVFVRGRTFDTDDPSLFIRRQVLLALQKLHDTGVVHRDLAERNILLEPLRPDGNVSGPDDFKVHIIDFDAIETGHECPGLEGDPPCEQLSQVVDMFGLARQ